MKARARRLMASQSRFPRSASFTRRAQRRITHQAAHMAKNARTTECRMGFTREGR